MQKISFLLLFACAVTMANAQRIDLNYLLRVYNSRNINDAFKNFNSLNGFEGKITVDSLKKDSLLVGIIGKDTISAQRFKGKIRIELTTDNSKTFQAIKVQAAQKLYFSSDYSRSGGGVSRHYYVYSDKPDMKVGDLWFILTECHRLNWKGTFYEIKLTTYNED